MNALEQLKTMTTIVADTGEFEAVTTYKPQDATTNPSLIYKASLVDDYQHVVEEAIQYALNFDADKQLTAALDRLFILFGKNILAVVPGRVSIEVDARLSFNQSASTAKAIELIAMFEAEGIKRERILIKLASTWEGIRAAQELEKQGIHCNLTLLFNYTQAIACAQAGVTLVSPFVGRIMDWYKNRDGVDGYAPAEDPGVRSVSSIYAYFKKHGHKTSVMGASFRNIEEILELAGCDLLTIAPSLMDELQNSQKSVTRKLDPTATTLGHEVFDVDEEQFRWDMNQDAMATEKLAEGIRNFSIDLVKLEKLVTDKLLTAKNKP